MSPIRPVTAPLITPGTTPEDRAFDEAVLRWALAGSARNESARQTAALLVTEAACRRLSRLDLSRLGLTSLGDFFGGKLEHLETLILSGNQLRDLPPSLGRLPNLRQLDLRDNRLHAIPEAIDHLPGNCSVELAGNLIPATVLAQARNTQHATAPAARPDTTSHAMAAADWFALKAR